MLIQKWLKKTLPKFGSETTFSKEHDADFLLDSVVEWNEYARVSVDLPGKRKYDHLLFKTCRGTMSDFLLAFQRMCIKLKPHKFYQHRRDVRKLLSRLQNNTSLLPGTVALFANYSKNLKKTEL